jgi:hypothetical protein
MSHDQNSSFVMPSDGIFIRSSEDQFVEKGGEEEGPNPDRDSHFKNNLNWFELEVQLRKMMTDIL